MKRKVGVVLLKAILIQIFVLSVVVFFVALANCTIKKGNTSDAQFGSDVVNVNKRDVIKSVYRYRLPLSGRVGRISVDGHRKRSPGNKKRHAKKKENVNFEKDEAKSNGKQKSTYLFNKTVDGTGKIETGRPKADKKHAERKRAEQKHAELNRAEQKHVQNGHGKHNRAELIQSKRNHTELKPIDEKDGELKHGKEKHAELGHTKHKNLNKTHSEQKHFEEYRLKQKRQERKRAEHKHLHLLGADKEDFRRQAKHAVFSDSNATHGTKTSQQKKEERTG